VLARYEHFENVPDDAASWNVSVRGAPKLAATLAEQHDLAILFRDLATLRTDAEVGAVDDWRWEGPAPSWAEWDERLGLGGITQRARRLADRRATAQP
jgi:hypothetical protein